MPTPDAVNELVVGYLFELRYPEDRWSGTMFAETLPKPEDVRNVVALVPATALLTLQGERDALMEALTPSGETKAAYMGEFTIAIEPHFNEDEEPDDEAEDAPDPYEHITVPWTTIKEIMAAIRARSNPVEKEPGR